jgi:hypothetical protein
MRKAMIAAMAAVAIACVLGLSAIAAPQANAATNADWAWPGMQYDIYKNNSWYTCSVGFPAWNSGHPVFHLRWALFPQYIRYPLPATWRGWGRRL